MADDKNINTPRQLSRSAGGQAMLLRAP
jgi:hypothetical protein